MKHTLNLNCAPHLRPLLLPKQLRKVVREACATLKTLDFDAIAFCGLSGSLIAPILAMRLNKTLLAVRKDDEVCHSPRKVEGDFGAKRYIIVDDFIDSGDTARGIIEKLEDAVSEATCIGFYAYAFDWDYDTDPKSPVPYFRDYQKLKEHLDL